MPQDSPRATIADVFYAYRLILGRAPDDLGILAHSRNVIETDITVEHLRRDFLASPDFIVPPAAAAQQAAKGIFFNYNSCFDAEQIIRSYAHADVQAKPGFLTNFLGVVIDPKFFPDLLASRAGTIDPTPIPSNWHADMAEWAAALRAVDLSGRRFTIIELGCGWGCWMNNTGAAARFTGRSVHLIGVEGDAAHVGFAHESLATNGFSGAEVTLHHGVAAATSGIALFPQEKRDGLAWGGQPIFGVTDEERDEAVASGEYDALKMFSLGELAAGHDRIDLLHVDIQGGEADLIDGSLDTLREKVRYLLIGTHSRTLEGRLFDTLLSAGWKLEIERPGLLHLNESGPFMHVDGVQGWRNLAL